MVRDAEQYAEEDRQRREEAEVRNRADTLVYTTEKFLAENAEKVPDDVKSEVESALADVKKALEGNDTETIRQATETAATASQKMGSAIYAQAQAEQQAAGGEGAAAGDAGTAQDSDNDVVDAEIVDDEGSSDTREGGAA
jgi:molecular chaperone DnaK